MRTFDWKDSHDNAIVQWLKHPTSNENSRCSIPRGDKIFQKQQIFKLKKYKNIQLVK